MKKSLNLFNRKKPRRRQREDDFVDFDEQYDEEYSDEDGYEDEDDYPDEEFEEEYGQDVDEDYPEDEDDSDLNYEDEEDYDTDYLPRIDEKVVASAGVAADVSVDDSRQEQQPEVAEEEYPEDGEDYPEGEENYPEEELSDDRYEEDEYPEDDDDYPEDDEDYPEDDESYPDGKYEDGEYDDYASDDDYDYDYDRDEDDEDYDRYEDEDDYPEEDDDRRRGGRYDRDDYTGRRGSRRGRRDRDGESVGARILEFIRNTSVAERAAAVVAVLLLAGGIATMAFYHNAKEYAAEVGSFAEVGADFQIDDVVGSSGLIAIADAEMARAMAAGMVEEIQEEEQEEEEVPDTAENVTIKMTLTTIKSDMKIKFINSETKKLVASVPFVVSVVTPDGTTIEYDDHDKDGIIYKNNLTAGKYKVTPKALSTEYDKYKLDTSAQSLTIKDTVEMKAVDVSNEIKKESQVNVAKEDTAVQEVVESVLTDTVEWVDSNQNSTTSSDGQYKYELIDKKDIVDPSTTSKLTFGSVRRMAAARARTQEPAPDDGGNTGSTEGSTEASTEASSDAGSESTTDAGTGSTTEASTGGTTEASTGGTTEASTGGTTEASTGGTTDASSEATTKEPEKPKDMSISLTASSIKVGQTTTVNVSGPSSYSVSSDNSAVATASNNTITAVGVGTARITVKATGYNDASTTVTVTEADKKNMTLSATSLAIKVGETGKITVTSGPSSFTIKSGNEAIAKVAADGTITPVAVGSATITFSAEGYNPATATVTVGAADKKDMTLSAKELTLGINEKGKITVTAGPTKYTVKSSDEKIATVASDGTITGIAAGKATITFSAEGYNDATVAVTVGKKEITLSVKALTLEINANNKIKVTAGPSKYTFKSSDEKIVKVASDGTVTGVAEGKATITVSAEGFADATVAVTVVKKAVLKDKNGNIIYVKDANGKYVEATYNDYYNGKEFYLKKANDGVRQGWWTIDGKTYFFDKNGNAVTGEQVIKGAKYSFGSYGALSSSSGTMGIDVSKWNGNINWAQVKNAGVNYAIIRCGYRGSSAGALIEDPKFRANIQGAQAAGIKVGVYFFSQAVNEVEAVEEASMCINLCKGYNLSFPVYIDIEASHGRGDQISASQRTANIKAFCGTIQGAGYRAGVYSNKTWFTQYMNAGQLTGYKIWLAQYAANVTYSATRYDMWQYTSKGSISGISGNVDMNILYN